MLRKNVASQFVHIAGVNATTGAVVTGATWTMRRCLDGTFAAGGATVTEDGSTGFYKVALAQADTNGNDIGYFFTATNCVPVTVNVVTTAADPTDSVRFGLTALPNAAAGATGGLPLSVDTSGRVDVLKINGTNQTARDIGASVLLSSGTGTGQLKLASGYVAMTWADIAAPTTVVNLSGTTIATVTNAVALPASATIAITGNITGNLSGSVGSVTGAVGSVTGAVGSVTGNVGGNVTGSVGSVVGNVGGNVVGSVGSVTASVTAGTVSDKTGYTLSATGSAALTEGYRTNGATGTINQILYEILAHLGEASITSTTKTLKKIDHSTSAATLTLDSSTTPTSITRST